MFIPYAKSFNWLKPSKVRCPFFSIIEALRPPCKNPYNLNTLHRKGENYQKKGITFVVISLMFEIEISYLSLPEEGLTKFNP